MWVVRADWQTPLGWELVWSGPEQALAYMEAVCSKAQQVRSMAARPESLLGDAVLLEQLFRPTALINALRQCSAR